MGCNHSSENGIFFKALSDQKNQFDSLKTALEISGYKNKSGFADTIKNPDWKKELEPFYDLNYEEFVKNNDILTDTIFDQRSNRYLVRGMNLESDSKSTYLILDSTFQLIQFSLKTENEGFWKSERKEFFWDKEGTFNYLYDYRNKGGDWNDYQWIGKAIR